MVAKRQYSAVDARTTQHEAYKKSLKARKRIEAAFEWIKTVGGPAKTKLICRNKLSAHALLGFAAYNLVRMGFIGD